MPKISVVISTFNEEKNMPRCLDSVKDLADEIVLVDGSSTDDTVKIAKEYGAKVVVTDNPPIFLINRQKAIDLATKEWILQVDADEVITPELAQEIKSTLEKSQSKQDSEQFNGYWIPRKNWFLGRFLMKGGQYPDHMLRLYRNGKAHFLLKDVHEQAIIDGKVGYLKEAMLHYPYKNFDKYYEKWTRYNKVFASQIKDELKGKNLFQKIFAAVGYLLLRPAHWFITTYGRHKGFMDGWSGFVFSLFSALRFPVSYLTYVFQS